MHLAVVLVALLLNLQGCDEEDDNEKEENVTAPVVEGNLTKNKTVDDVWVGEHSNRPAYTGPPAKLGHWDEKAKSIKPDPLPGKGGKLLEAERSYERALFSSNDAERQEHRLEKEKHLEDYYKDHPPSTTTKAPTTTLSTKTSKPGSEGDTGGEGTTRNTDAKENTVQPSTEPAKQSTPIEEPEADKTLKSANGSVALFNNSNATGPAAATSVGSIESAPTSKVQEALAIESAKRLVPSGQHPVMKAPWAPHEAGGTKMDEADSEKLDGAGEAGEAGGTKKDASDSEKLDEAGTAGGTQTDEADLEKLDEAGGSKMDADEEEEVAPKIEEETIGDPNEPAKTDEGEVQVNPSGHAMEDKDEEMESPQDGANSEVKDSKDDSSKETSSQQGQEEDDAHTEDEESSPEEEGTPGSSQNHLSAMELGEAKRADRLHRLHSEHEALHELELRQDRELQDLRQELERRQDRELEHFRERQHEELELERRRIKAAESQTAPALLEMDQHLHRHRHGSRKMGQWLQDLADADPVS